MTHALEMDVDVSPPGKHVQAGDEERGGRGADGGGEEGGAQVCWRCMWTTAISALIPPVSQRASREDRSRDLGNVPHVCQVPRRKYQHDVTGCPRKLDTPQILDTPKLF